MLQVNKMILSEVLCLTISKAQHVIDTNFEPEILGNYGIVEQLMMSLDSKLPACCTCSIHLINGYLPGVRNHSFVQEMKLWVGRGVERKVR